VTKVRDFHLYHYTTIDAFINIVERQEIWASNVFYMKDGAEFHQAAALARDLLKTEIDKCSNSTEREDLHGLRDSLERAKPGAIALPVFVWSLSKEEDDLVQWNAYCREGGLALGFLRDDIEYLRSSQSYPGRWGLASCIYNRKKQKDVVRQCIADAVSGTTRTRPGQLMSPKLLQVVRGKVLHHMLAEKPIKHYAFHHEREWRLIASLDQGQVQNDKEQIGYRTLNGLAIPYVKIKLDPEGNRRIWKNVRVTVGPCPHPYELKTSIEGLLYLHCRPKDRSKPGKVEVSKVPYRYW
jgi:hypothetical protein